MPITAPDDPLKCLEGVDADDGKEKTQKDEGGLEGEGGEGDADEEDEGEAEEDEAGPQLQLSPSGQYFIQTPDGQIIQVGDKLVYVGIFF